MTLDDYFAAPGAKTPAELSDEVGISESTLSRIRRGKQNTTRDVILAIIAATGEKVTADALLGLHGRGDATAEPSASASKTEENIREDHPDQEAGHGHPFSPTSSSMSSASRANGGAVPSVLKSPASSPSPSPTAIESRPAI